MYYAVIQQFAKTLGNLDAILGKAASYAGAKKFEVDNFLTARLAPDMLPFTKQIQIATDVAKAAAASLSGTDAPKFDDQEKTLAELRERIKKTITYLNKFGAADFSDIDPQMPVKIPYPQGKAMRAEDALVSRAIPNFFFHVTTTYALLRQGGVEIGKGDYLGQLNIFDA